MSHTGFAFPVAGAGPVQHVPRERTSSLLWLLQRAEARLRLGSLQRGQLCSGQGTACLELSQDKEQAGGRAGRRAEVFGVIFFWFCFLTICPFLFFSLKSVSPWAASHTLLHPSRPFAEGDSRSFCSGEPRGLGYQGLGGRASPRAVRAIAGIWCCFGAAWPIPGGAMGQRCNWGGFGKKPTCLTSAPARARTRSRLCVNEEHWELFCLCCSCNAKSECC